MGNYKYLLLGVSAVLLLAVPANADPAPAIPDSAPIQTATPPDPQSTTTAPPAQVAPSEAAPATAAQTSASQVQDDPVLAAVRTKLTSEPAAEDEHDRDDQKALIEFYNGRHGEGLWVTASGLKPEAKALAAEIANAGNYALDVSRFKVPNLADPKRLSSMPATPVADAFPIRQNS